jgi:hypothetical protein
MTAVATWQLTLSYDYGQISLHSHPVEEGDDQEELLGEAFADGAGRMARGENTVDARSSGCSSSGRATGTTRPRRRSSSSGPDADPGATVRLEAVQAAVQWTCDHPDVEPWAARARVGSASGRALGGRTRADQAPGRPAGGVGVRPGAGAGAAGARRAGSGARGSAGTQRRSKRTGSPHPAARAAAVQALADRWREDAAARAWLIELAEHADQPDLRKAAVQAVAQHMPVELSAGDLGELVRARAAADPDPDVRWAAMREIPAWYTRLMESQGHVRSPRLPRGPSARRGHGGSGSKTPMAQGPEVAVRGAIRSRGWPTSGVFAFVANPAPEMQRHRDPDAESGLGVAAVRGRRTRRTHRANHVPRAAPVAHETWDWVLAFHGDPPTAESIEALKRRLAD